MLYVIPLPQSVNVHSWLFTHDCIIAGQQRSSTWLLLSSVYPAGRTACCRASWHCLKLQHMAFTAASLR
jgi:hypothetical protein